MESSELEGELRTLKRIAMAYRPARAPDAQGIGIVATIRFKGGGFEVWLETHRDDGGYGQSLARTEHTFPSLGDALQFVYAQGFSPEDVKVRDPYA
jgi:hypothetical protein